MNHRPSIRLNSGNLFYFDDPASSIYTIDDVAHNLAKEARFNGATKGLIAYSVAQHAVNVSRILPPPFQREGLHHDDPEAFYKDLTTWLKQMCPDYVAQLQRGEFQHAQRLGLPTTMSPEVKKADLQMLRLEKDALFERYDDIGFEHLSHIDVSDVADLVDLRPWSPAEAKAEYLARYKELNP